MGDELVAKQLESKESDPILSKPAGPVRRMAASDAEAAGAQARLRDSVKQSQDKDQPISASAGRGADRITATLKLGIRRRPTDTPAVEDGGSLIETSVGQGRSKITLRRPDGTVGSVTVGAVDKTSVKATDLIVDPQHRGLGYGKQLVAAAAGVGARSGKSSVQLGSEDDGSGRLDGWYQSLGFNRTGKGRDCCSKFEAPVSKIRVARIRRSVGGHLEASNRVARRSITHKQYSDGLASAPRSTTTAAKVQRSRSRVTSGDDPAPEMYDTEINGRAGLAARQPNVKGLFRLVG